MEQSMKIERNFRECSEPKIHERTVSLRFLSKILRVFRLEVSEYNVYITNQFQTTFAGGGGGRYVLIRIRIRILGSDTV
jgi:hypothetical protein